MRLQFTCTDYLPRKENRVTQEKYWGVVSNQVPVPVVRVKLYSKAAGIPSRVCRPAFPAHCGEANGQRGSFANLFKNPSLRVLANVMLHLKVAKSSYTNK